MAEEIEAQLGTLSCFPIHCDRMKFENDMLYYIIGEQKQPQADALIAQKSSTEESALRMTGHLGILGKPSRPSYFVCLCVLLRIGFVRLGDENVC